MESTIGLYNSELIDFDGRRWAGVKDVESATARWVHWYNTSRVHTSIGMASPLEYEALYLVSQAFPSGQAA